MNQREFELAFRDLLAAYQDTGDNPMSTNVKGCRHCASCHFCVNCEACYRCTHGTGLVTCSHCTRCDDCQNCHGCAYCVGCSNCSGSKYLVRCDACADCTYCFGCVGLQKKDFHILNEPYDRKSYFELTAKLKRALGIKGA